MDDNNTEEVSRTGAGLDLDLLGGYRARIAVREAWKHNTGKYPKDDPALTTTQRIEDGDVAYIQQLAEEVRRLRAVLVAAKALAKSCMDVPGYSNERQYDEDALDDLEAAIEAAQGGQGEEADHEG